MTPSCLNGLGSYGWSGHMFIFIKYKSNNTPKMRIQRGERYICKHIWAYFLCSRCRCLL